MHVSILFNLWLIILYFLSVIRVLFINFIKFIKFNFKGALDFFLINISISEGFLQIRTSIRVRILLRLIVALICMHSIQSVLFLNFPWNHEAILMPWVHSLSAWLSWIRLEVIGSLLLSRVRIVNMSSFISSNLFNIWLMLSKSILVLIHWVPAVDNLVAAIVNNFRIVSLSLGVGASSSMCSLSYSLLDEMSLWLDWLLSLKVINKFFF